MSRYLRGEERARARRFMFDALREAGCWLSTGQAHEAYYQLHGVDTSFGGWIWGLPEGVPVVYRAQADLLLAQLHEAGWIERKQRKRLATRYWRAPELPRAPDALPGLLVPVPA